MSTNWKENGLEVSHFMGIKSARLKLTRFNVLVGEQASGKSVLAKLCYFMTDAKEKIELGAIEGKTKREIDKDLSKRFAQIFPPAAWGSGNFSIKYWDGGYRLNIERKKSSNSIKFVFEENLSKFVASVRRRVNDLDVSSDQFGSRISSKWRKVEEYAASKRDACFGSDSASNSVFIPAGRSYYSAMKEGVWEFIAKSITIDPIYTDFGTVYESTKSFFDRYGGVKKTGLQEYTETFQDVIRGMPRRERGQDYIDTLDGRRVPLQNASSGQQEVYPLYATLRVVGFFSSLPTAVLVEEPEAHLYPASQAKIVWLLAYSLRYMPRGSSLIITTHSPYVLSTVNNLILAEQALKSINSKKKIHASAVARKFMRAPLDSNSVSIFPIEGSRVSGFERDEFGLISAKKIDQISSEIAEISNELLDFVYQQ
mgnify:CR=1 FL=1